MTDHLKIGLLQMMSGPDVDANLAKADTLLSQLGDPCDLIVLPEYCLALGPPSLVQAAARSEKEWCDVLGAFARRSLASVVFGGVPVAETENRITNSSLVFSPDGVLAARYDKIHLFHIEHAETPCEDESRLFSAGTQPQTFSVNGWRVGLSICYDLRFPELFRSYIPVDLILCTAAFTEFTGKAHWHVLLRARAIENQCFVATAAQCGTDGTTGTRYYGHTLAVDPWGEVISEADRPEQSMVVTIEKRHIRQVRASLPALSDHAAYLRLYRTWQG